MLSFKQHLSVCEVMLQVSEVGGIYLVTLCVNAINAVLRLCPCFVLEQSSHVLKTVDTYLNPVEREGGGGSPSTQLAFAIVVWNCV